MFLRVSNLCKYYQKGGNNFAAADRINFSLTTGEIVGLLGISGSGKSTLARLLTGLIPADSGTILLDEKPVNFFSQSDRRNYYRQIQYIFQEPASAFHPSHTIGSAIMEPLLHNGYNKAQAKTELTHLLQQTGLDAAYADRFIYQLSGGEAQRAAIARAISIRPRLLICDEITSALDTLTQRQILNLLLHLQQQYQTTILFITHDIALAAGFCHRLLVMSQGSIVEEGLCTDILQNPRHPSTRQLLQAAHELTFI